MRKEEQAETSLAIKADQNPGTAGATIQEAEPVTDEPLEPIKMVIFFNIAMHQLESLEKFKLDYIQRVTELIPKSSTLLFEIESIEPDTSDRNSPGDACPAHSIRQQLP